MMNVDSPPCSQSISSLNESPTFAASARSASLNLGFGNNLKRPLIQTKKNLNLNINSHSHSRSNSNSNSNGYKVNPDFFFSSWNKENSSLPSSTSNNSLYKSLTFNGSPSISRKSSVKKHLRKKSSTNMLKLNQSLMNGNSRRNSNSSSHTNVIVNQLQSNKQQQHQNQNSHQNSHHNETRHSKSNSIISISSNSIFHSLSNKPSIDSIFNFSHKGGATISKSQTSPLISPYPQVSPNQDETASYYSSEEVVSEEDITAANTSLERFKYLDADVDDESDDDDQMDFGGSPLQRKKIDNDHINSKIKQFNLQRHRSLMQFSSNGPIPQKYKFDTEQLTSNINGLTVKSDEDDLNFGNSVLHKSPFKFSSFEHGKIPRINVEQLKFIINEYKMKDQSPDGKFCKYFDELHILDCRFKFEYDGGHINDAINISSYTELENRFFTEDIINKTPLEFNREKRKLLIFHCEFSSHRGPMKADQLRYYDRSICGDFYPNLYYPDVIVLEGGYKDYYESEKTLHKSLSYIEMDHPSYKDERDRNLSLLRKESSLSRQNSRSSSTASLTRRPSHNSLKTTASSSILDFSMVNKVETNIARPSKRFLSCMNSIPSTQTNFPFSENENHVSASLKSKAAGLFGGFGNNHIDLDSLVDNNAESDFPTDFESANHNFGGEDGDGDDDDDDDDDDDIGYKVDKVELSSLFTQTNRGKSWMSKLENSENLQTYTQMNTNTQPYTQKSPSRNDGFKIPLPRPRFNRRNSLHSRSKTVSSFSYSNHSGMKSAPLLSTPEKANATFVSNFSFQHNDLSVYSVKEDTEFEIDLARQNYSRKQSITESTYSTESVGEIVNKHSNDTDENEEEEDDDDDDGYVSIYSDQSRQSYTPFSK